MDSALFIINDGGTIRELHFDTGSNQWFVLSQRHFGSNHLNVSSILNLLKLYHSSKLHSISVSVFRVACDKLNILTLKQTFTRKSNSQ